MFKIILIYASGKRDVGYTFELSKMRCIIESNTDLCTSMLTAVTRKIYFYMEEVAGPSGIPDH